MTTCGVPTDAARWAKPESFPTNSAHFAKTAAVSRIEGRSKYDAVVICQADPHGPLRHNPACSGRPRSHLAAPSAKDIYQFLKPGKRPSSSRPACPSVHCDAPDGDRDGRQLVGSEGIAPDRRSDTP